MNIRKHILCAALLCAALLPLAAGDWYVCLGSFRVAANAQHLSVLLRERGLPNAITRHGNSPGTLYRVVYERPFADRDEARIFKNGLLGDSRVRALGISGLWICEVEIDEPQDAVGQSAQASEKIDDKQDTTEILQKNDGEQIPVSDEKPFSLKVRSYKEKHPAVQNSKRLRENDIDAYVVKTYDDSTYFSFDVHAGAFATAEESADTEAALAALGIAGATLSDYTEIKEKMRRYDEVVQQDDVVFETAENATIPEFSAAVRTCLTNLPVSWDFIIESIVIVDFETLADSDIASGRFSTLAPTEGTHALAMAVYRDDLFGKRVEVTVAECAVPLPPPEDVPAGEAVQFALPGDDVLHAHITADRDIWTVEGMNTERTLLIKIDAYDFSDDEFEAFMNNAWADSAAVIYPQLRKSLCVLPKNADKRRFAAFTLGRVNESYAEKKGYAEWAIPIVGHWEASGYFLQDGEEVSVSFFDMDYEHNARRIHGIFMDEHEKSNITSQNHPAEVNGSEAWYIVFSVKEISFSIKSFIVAVDAGFSASLAEDDLIAFASDLLIWEQ